MTAAVDNQDSRARELQRCPVFKIDLKGRFVNVDDLTEQLIGVQAENLFGRSIKDYLDKDSYRGLQDLIRSGSRFDFSYEAIDLVIIDHRKIKHNLCGIVSLNFIAGNPANYQVILTPSGITGDSPSANVGRFERMAGQIIDLAIDFSRNPDWKKLAVCLQYSEEIKQVGIYGYDGVTLNLLAELKSENMIDPVDMSLIDKDHLKIMSMDHPKPEYKNGEERFEISLPLVSGDSCWGLLRLILSETQKKLVEGLEKIGEYIGFAFKSYAQLDKDAGTAEDEPGLNFLEIMQNLGCTIFSYTFDGILVDELSTPSKDICLLKEYANVETLLKSLQEFRLASTSCKSVIEISLPSRESILFPDMGLISGNGKSYFYKIMKCGDLSNGTAEYSILLFPEMYNYLLYQMDDSLLQLFLDTAKIFLEPIRKYTDKLAGQFYPRLNRDGRFYIDSIQDNCIALEEAVKRFLQLQDFLGRKEDLTEVNLTDQVNKAIERVQGETDGVKITFENKVQILLSADPVKLQELLRSIMSGLIARSETENIPTLNIDIAGEKDQCKMEFITRGTIDYSTNAEEVFEPLNATVDDRQSGRRVFELNLPIARLLIESMGGEIAISQKGKNEIAINALLPLKG